MQLTLCRVCWLRSSSYLGVANAGCLLRLTGLTGYEKLENKVEPKAAVVKEVTELCIGARCSLLLSWLSNCDVMRVSGQLWSVCADCELIGAR